MAIVATSQNLSAVTYAQAETITVQNGATLTISATPAIRPGTIQCITSGKVRIENSSTTVPLIFDLHDMDHDFQFEANGVLEIRGAPMPLGTGTGLAQSWNFATLFGGVIRHMTYVEVEESAGSGVYMPWPVIHDDPKFVLNAGIGSSIGGSVDFQAGNTAAGQVLFWHETNRVLRCGDNTNGRAIPAGCAVRIPNIYISNRLQTNQTRTLSINTTGTPTGGDFTLQLHRENGTLIGTTAAIAFGATAAAVQTAIQAVTGAGTVTIGGGPLPTIVQVTWAGIYAAERLGIRVAANNLTGGTNPQVRCFENSAANLTIIDLNPLGMLDAEWCAFSDKIRFSVDVFRAIRLIAVGTGADGTRMDNANGSVEIDGLTMQQSPFTPDQSNRMSSVLGAVSMRRVVGAKKSNSFALELNNLPGLTTMDRVVAMNYGKRNNTGNRAVSFTTLAPNITLRNITAIGAGIALTNLSGISVVNYAYADGTTATQDLTQAQSVINTTNCANLTLANYSDAGPQVARNNLIGTDSSSSNIRVFGATTSMVDQTSAVLNMQASGLEISNVTATNVRAGPLLDLPGNFLANGLRARKVFATFATAQQTAGLDACQGGQYDLVSSTIAGITETFSGVNDFVGGNYADPGLTPTTGHVTFGPFGAGVGLELTGAAFTDAAGGLVLGRAGDTAVITMPFAMHGITGFQSVVPRLFLDAPGAIARVAVVGAPGAPTGGTFTISVSNSAGVLIGTTAPIAFNAATATVATAINAIAGLGATAAVGGGLTAGYVITFSANTYIVTANGAALTGGTEPGVAYAVGRARLLDGTEDGGAIVTEEFAMRVPGTDWPAYTALTGANLAAAFSALTGHNAGGAGLEMRLRLAATQANPLTKINQISLPTNINPALWSVGDATITLNGPAATDVTRIVRASDNAVLYSFTGSGTQSFTVGANFGTSVYLRRENASGTVLMVTLPATQSIVFGVNPAANLFYGSQVQLAQATSLDTLAALVAARLDATVSSRLPTSGYAAPPSAAANASAVWSQTLETGFDASRILRTTAAAVAGKTSGGPQGFTARNLADTQDQITGTATSTGRSAASYGA